MSPLTGAGYSFSHRDMKKKKDLKALKLSQFQTTIVQPPKYPNGTLKVNQLRNTATQIPFARVHESQHKVWLQNCTKIRADNRTWIRFKRRWMNPAIEWAKVGPN